MVNTGGKGFPRTTNIYNKPNYASILVPEKKNPEWKVSVDMEGTAIKKQE